MAPANTRVSKLPKRFELPFTTPCTPLQSIANRPTAIKQNHAQISQTRISETLKYRLLNSRETKRTELDIETSRHIHKPIKTPCAVKISAPIDHENFS
ncbi:MAG: hypothetical protein ABIK08_02730 [Pseudomonadota bacterium]